MLARLWGGYRNQMCFFSSKKARVQLSKLLDFGNSIKTKTTVVIRISFKSLHTFVLHGWDVWVGLVGVVLF